MEKRANPKRRIALLTLLIISGLTIFSFQNCSIQSSQAPIVLQSAVPTHTFSKPPTFTEISTYILKPKCVICHASGTLNYSSFESVMASNTVVSGDPTNSSFYQQVLSGAMPQNSTALDIADSLAIREWIEAGALS